MKIVLTALNAKYTHDNLAVRYLQAYCSKSFPDLIVREFNINQNLSLILAELVDLDPDVIGFSCYIWNIGETIEVIKNLKKVRPDLVIVLGGPEVSYDYHQLMKNHREIDYIVAGEGEKPFLQLLSLLKHTRIPSPPQLAGVSSLVYRVGEKILNNPKVIMDLSELPGAYSYDLSRLKNKIVYYETSRGCPFNCEYCLSSRSGNVRYFPLEQCKREIKTLAEMGIEQIRFVDRTFNCNPDRAYELLKFIISLDTNTRFQFEIGGDLLSEDLLKLLEKAPYNRLQFEIGVQSTNPKTLKQIGRKTDLGKLAENVKVLKNKTDVRFLLDLIAGLPEESFARFGYSFDFVYNLQPTKIQLGFLKLLKGSRLRERVDEFGCIFTDKAPYEVLQTNSISYPQLSLLKVIEALVEMFYNSGRFSYSLNYLIRREQVRPFELFANLAHKWKAKGYHLVYHSVFKLYNLLWELIGSDDPVLLNYLRFDYRNNEPKRTTPSWLTSSDHKKTIQKYSRELIRDGSIFKYLPKLKPLELSPREISRKFMIEEFNYLIYPWQPIPPKKKQMLLFDYSDDLRIRVYDLNI